MIDCITIEYDQLQRTRQLEDAFDLLLHFAKAIGATARALHDGPLRWIVHYGSLRQRNVGHDAGYNDASLEFALEEVEEGLLHHVGYLVTLKAWTH